MSITGMRGSNPINSNSLLMIVPAHLVSDVRLWMVWGAPSGRILHRLPKKSPSTCQEKNCRGYIPVLAHRPNEEKPWSMAVTSDVRESNCEIHTD